MPDNWMSLLLPDFAQQLQAFGLEREGGSCDGLNHLHILCTGDDVADEKVWNRFVTTL